VERDQVMQVEILIRMIWKGIQDLQICQTSLDHQDLQIHQIHQDLNCQKGEKESELIQNQLSSRIENLLNENLEKISTLSGYQYQHTFSTNQKSGRMKEKLSIGLEGFLSNSQEPGMFNGNNKL
jgi:hypothetical protein